MDPHTALTTFLTENNWNWNPPATPEQITAVEEALKVKLPEDYTSFLTWHNGTDDPDEGLCSSNTIPETHAMLLETWEELAEDDPDTAQENLEPGTGRLLDGGFNPGWVPFLNYGDGRYLLLDTTPGPNGTYGQVIEYDIDGSDGVLHPSFTAWAQSLTEDN